MHRSLARALLAAAVLAAAPPALAAQEPADAETYGASAVDRLPEIANREEMAATMEAEYPAELREAGISGTVVVRFRVLDDGAVDGASLRVSRSTDPRFAGAAARVVRGLRFFPAELRGRRVRVWVELPLQFEVAAGPRFYES